MAITGLKVRVAGAWAEMPTLAALTPTTDNMIQSVAGAWASRTPAQVKAALAIGQADVTGLVAALAAKADATAIVNTVRVATTGPITISTALNNTDTLDGVVLNTGDLVLVKDQTAATENGVYIVGATPVRAPSFDTFNEHVGARFVVSEGTIGADTAWLGTSNLGGTLGTTPITIANEMWLSKALGIYNVKAFGAKGDGATDDRLAIQACIDAAPAGSTIYFPPGTYLVSKHPTTTNCLHIPTQRLALVGADSHDASVIKLMDTQGDYYSIITDQPIGSGASGAGSTTNISGFVMRYLTIDQNDANNPIVDRSYATGSLFNTYPAGGGYPRLGVRCYNGFDGLIEYCHFTNIDSVNTIALNSSTGVGRWTIRENLFDNIGRGAAHDHSTIYFSGLDVTVDHNRFYGIGLSAIVAIELHGSGQMVTRNIIDKMYGGMNITGAAAIANGGSKREIVTDNVMTGMGCGIALWSRVYSPVVRAATTANITIATDLNVGDVIDGVTLALNDLVLVKDQTSAFENGVYVVGPSPARAAAYSTFNSHVGVDIGVVAGGVTSVNGASVYRTTATAGGTLGSTALPFALQFKPALERVLVSGNVIEIDYDAWPAGYRAGVLTDAGSDSAFRHIKIVDNQIHFLAYTGTPNTGTDYYSCGVAWTRAGAPGGGMGPDTTIEISRNEISGSISAGIRFDPRASARNVKINGNKITNPGQGTPAVAGFRTGVSVSFRDPLPGVTNPATYGDNIEVSDNETIDTRSTHLIANAVDASFNTSTALTRAKAVGNSYVCYDGTTNLPVLAIGTVGTWYSSHTMAAYQANTGSNFAAGSSVRDTSTGIVRTQTATPAGSTWAVPAAATPPDVQFFTTPGANTWTKPTNAVSVHVEIIGGGGGGGSGRRGTSGTVLGGGGGGGGSILTQRTFKASDLGATETVTIGTGGPGAAAITVNDTNGGVGTIGVASTFGTKCSSAPGIGGNGATGVAGGTGAVSWVTSTAVPSSGGGAGGGAGAVGTSQSPALFGAGGGAGGGGISATPAAFNGGASVGSYLSNVGGGGAGGVVDTTAPGSGTAPGVQGSPGPGGAGGAASITTTGQTGATPNGYGGGGGGGGASLNGNNSGAGGAGAPGSCKVTTYF